SGIHARVVIKGSGNGKYHYRINGVPSAALTADGMLHPVTIYLSQTTTAESYVGPDGAFRTLNAGCITLWVGDQLMLENVTRETAFTSPDAARFKFRSPASIGTVFRFDDVVAENRFSAATPARPNDAPQAVDDSVSTDEGET